MVVSESESILTLLSGYEVWETHMEIRISAEGRGWEITVEGVRELSPEEVVEILEERRGGELIEEIPF